MLKGLLRKFPFYSLISFLVKKDSKINLENLNLEGFIVSENITLESNKSKEYTKEVFIKVATTGIINSSELKIYRGIFEQYFETSIIDFKCTSISEDIFLEPSFEISKKEDQEAIDTLKSLKSYNKDFKNGKVKGISKEYYEKELLPAYKKIKEALKLAKAAHITHSDFHFFTLDVNGTVESEKVNFSLSKIDLIEMKKQQE